MIYKIIKIGMFRNVWKCWCGNTSRKAGFYPCNAEGEYQRDIFGRGKFYACSRCGRIVEPKTLHFVGLTRYFKLGLRELRDHITALEAEGIQPVGLNQRYLLRRLTSRL